MDSLFNRRIPGHHLGDRNCTVARPGRRAGWCQSGVHDLTPAGPARRELSRPCRSPSPAVGRRMVGAAEPALVRCPATWYNAPIQVCPGRPQVALKGTGVERKSLWHKPARVAELADALDLGSSGETRTGSNPVSRIYNEGEGIRRLPARPSPFGQIARMVRPLLFRAYPS